MRDLWRHWTLDVRPSPTRLRGRPNTLRKRSTEASHFEVCFYDKTVRHSGSSFIHSWKSCCKIFLQHLVDIQKGTVNTQYSSELLAIEGVSRNLIRRVVVNLPSYNVEIRPFVLFRSGTKWFGWKSLIYVGLCNWVHMRVSTGSAEEFTPWPQHFLKKGAHRNSLAAVEG